MRTAALKDSFYTHTLRKHNLKISYGAQITVLETSSPKQLGALAKYGNQHFALAGPS